MQRHPLQIVDLCQIDFVGNGQFDRFQVPRHGVHPDNFAGCPVDGKAEIAVAFREFPDQRFRFFLSLHIQSDNLCQGFEPIELLQITVIDRHPDPVHVCNGIIYSSDFRAGGFHRESEITVFSGQFGNQPGGFLLAVDGKIGFQRQLFQTLEFPDILGPPDLEGQVRNRPGDRVQTLDLPGGPVDDEAEIAVFFTQFDNQGFRVSLLFEGEFRFQRETFQFVELGKVGFLHLGDQPDALKPLSGGRKQDDFLLRPVDFHAKVAVFAGQFLDQTGRLVSLRHGEIHLQRELFQAFQLFQIFCVLDSELHRAEALRRAVEFLDPDRVVGDRNAEIAVPGAQLLGQLPGFRHFSVGQLLFFGELLEPLHPELVRLAEFVVLLPEFPRLVREFSSIIRCFIEVNAHASQDNSEGNQCRRDRVSGNQRHYGGERHHRHRRDLRGRRQQKIPNGNCRNGNHGLKVRSREQRGRGNGNLPRLVEGDGSRRADRFRRSVCVGGHRGRRRCKGHPPERIGHCHPARHDSPFCRHCSLCRRLCFRGDSSSDSGCPEGFQSAGHCRPFCCEDGLRGCGSFRIAHQHDACRRPVGRR